MYKSCKNENAAQRQVYIANTFMQMLQTQMAEEITISQLCKQAQIPRKAFYRYFDSKDDVLLFFIDTVLYAQNVAVQKQNEKKRTTQGDLEDMFTYWLQNKSVLRLLKNAKKFSLLLSRAVERSVEAKPAARLITNNDNENTVRLTTLISTTSFLLIVSDWEERGCIETPAQMAQVTAKLFTQPLYKTL